MAEGTLSPKGRENSPYRPNKDSISAPELEGEFFVYQLAEGQDVLYPSPPASETY